MRSLKNITSHQVLLVSITGKSDRNAASTAIRTIPPLTRLKQLPFPIPVVVYTTILYFVVKFYVENFKPQDCIVGKFSRLQRRISRIFRRHIRPYGVTNSQLGLLFVLSKCESCSQKELSEIAVLEKSTLKRNIDLIVRNEWAFQDAAKQISITGKGRSMVQHILPSWKLAMEEVKTILGADGINALQILEDKF